MKFLKSYPLLYLLLFSFIIPAPVAAKIFYSKEEALEIAFGADATVEMLPLFLRESEVETIQKLASAKLSSTFFTFYVGKKAGKILGYAVIETHKVRTKPETLLIVLNPEGLLTKVETLAFHEPPEYQPSARWYAQMYQLLLEETSFRAEVQGISGATLSSRAAIDSIRLTLAIFQLLVAEQQ